MQRRHLNATLTLGLSLAALGVWAASPPIFTIPHKFTAGDPARASEVNDNFTALVDKINSLQSQVDNLQSQLQNNTVLQLNGKLSLVNDPITGYATALFTDVNVQIVNGLGATDSAPDGLGNLIIGYNEAKSDAWEFCSDGQYTDAVTCRGNYATWAKNQRSGSHNLVLGIANAYTSFGGFLAGQYNIVNGPAGSVSGGLYNTASGRFSTVSGGENNTASNEGSAVSGGRFNVASGSYASVSGGGSEYVNDGNYASGDYSSISGGADNHARGDTSSVSGGVGISADIDYQWCGGASNCH